MLQSRLEKTNDMLKGKSFQGKRKLAVILVIYLLATCLSSTSTAQTSIGTVYVEPARTTVVIFTTFNVNVSVANVTEPLYSYIFVLNYDTNVLEGVDIWIPEDHFLKPITPSNIFIVDPGTIDQTTGEVTVAMSLLGTELGKTGNGTLYTVSFRAEKPGNTLLAITGSPVVDSFHYMDIMNSVLEVVIPDFDKDGKVGISDLVVVGQAFGSLPGDEGWNANCDANKDDRINIIDVAVTGRAYGMTAT